MRTRNHIETAGLEALDKGTKLTKKQVRYLLAGTASDGFVYGLFLKALADKVVIDNGEEFLKAIDIINHIKRAA